jgi:hypothetical protein
VKSFDLYGFIEILISDLRNVGQTEAADEVSARYVVVQPRARFSHTLASLWKS